MFTHQYTLKGSGWGQGYFSITVTLRQYSTLLSAFVLILLDIFHEFNNKTEEEV